LNIPYIEKMVDYIIRLIMIAAVVLLPSSGLYASEEVTAATTTADDCRPSLFNETSGLNGCMVELAVILSTDTENATQSAIQAQETAIDRPVQTSDCCVIAALPITTDVDTLILTPQQLLPEKTPLFFRFVETPQQLLPDKLL
jgi:hypothetical protein